jgi:hypothetical protein
MISKNSLGCGVIEDRNQYQITFDDPAQFWCPIQETEVGYDGQEVGRRQVSEEVVVKWTESVTLVWYCLRLSKYWIIKTKRSIIKSINTPQKTWQASLTQRDMSVSVTKQFIEARCNIDLQQNDGYTPLFTEAPAQMDMCPSRNRLLISW